MAADMNARFVNVKVDREERPDVDAVYMDAVQAMTGRGGWPMTVFLTPDGEPFYGGTYFPKHNFRQLMAAITDVWRNRRDDLDTNTEALREALSRTARLRPADDVPGAAHLTRAVQALAPGVRRRVGRLRRGAEVPVDDEPRPRARALTSARAMPGLARDRHDLARRDGVGRHVRPHRRRLRPLLRRPRVARPPLREDAVRPGAARTRVRPRRGRPRTSRAGARSSTRRSTTCCATSASPAAGSPRPRTPTPPAPTGTATRACSTRGRSRRCGTCSAPTPTSPSSTTGSPPEGNFEGRSIPNRLHARGSLERPAGGRVGPPAPVRGPRAARPARASTTRCSRSGTR